MNIHRREFLGTLGAGLLLGVDSGLPAGASQFEKLPARMPKGRSILDFRGDVRIDGKPATSHTMIHPQSRIETANDSHAVFVLGNDAFLMRENTKLELRGDGLIRNLRLVAGAILSVVGKREPEQSMTVRVSAVTIGIRGTGFYAETDPEKTYFCTCYGHTTIEADGHQIEDVVSKHHESRLILTQPRKGLRIAPSTFRLHKDHELMKLESLCGRKVPF